MSGRARSQRETLAWLVAASAAVSVCSGGGTHAAAGLLAHPSGPALAAAPRSGGLVVWLSLVTRDVVGAWPGIAGRPSHCGVGHLNATAVPCTLLPDLASEPARLDPSFAPTPLHAWGGRFKDIDLPPPGR